jgi:plastocyanin
VVAAAAVNLRSRHTTAGARLAACAGFVVVLAGLLAGCGSPANGRTAHAHHTVVMHMVRFNPDHLTIAAGDTVTWQNKDLVPHTSSGSDSSWDSGSIGPDSAWTHVFETSGSHPYGCRFHPTMHARLTVR